MKHIKTLIQKAQISILLNASSVYERMKSPIKGSSGNEFTEKLGLIICAIVLIAIFLTAMKSMTTSNLGSIGTKMEALFS